MHTFFVNTTGKELENYSDIFEIQHETRRLVSLECPLAKWNDEEKGYKACVRKMGELIDSYKDINNDFNLIIYIDLLSYDIYTSIAMNKHRERYACIKALHTILRHYIKSTFIDGMYQCGRMPQEVLIIFEENQLPKDKDEITEDGKNLIRSYTRTILGLPSDSKIDEIVYNTASVGEETISSEQICEKIINCTGSCIGEGVLHTYSDLINIFVSEAKRYETSEQPVKQLLDRIVNNPESDDVVVYSVTFVTNRRAGISNKQEKTRRNLRLCFYIFACVEEETVFDKALFDKEGILKAKAFADIDWKEVGALLAAKVEAFRKKYNETQRLSESFSKANLAPPLYAFDNQRFALDEYGKKGKTFDVIDVEKDKDQEKENKEAQEGIVQTEREKAVVVNDACGRCLFSQEEYPEFDYRGDDFNESILSTKATAEQYEAEAKKLRKHHLDYLQRLKIHVSDRLSNYAGRSAENEPALLRKRKVSIAQEDFEDGAKDYRYVKPGKPEETKKLNTVQSISQTAYTSTLLEYMEFCAGRSVAVTDIEEQCNWFITRVHQIKESLRKIQLVAIGLLFAIIILYIPFVAIQWEAIMKNAMTVMIALVSVAIPLATLYLVFAIASMLQRRKYRKAWKEFKDKSDQILEENAIAAEKYDQLLTVYVPALRWVYEYTLDVEFYAECCKMARAKINHHSQKLYDRVVTVGNIIEDLEMNISECGQAQHNASGNTEEEINYNVAFCSGKRNKNFYSIIDKHFLETVNQ